MNTLRNSYFEIPALANLEVLDAKSLYRLFKYGINISFVIDFELLNESNNFIFPSLENEKLN